MQGTNLIDLLPFFVAIEFRVPIQCGVVRQIDILRKQQTQHSRNTCNGYGIVKQRVMGKQVRTEAICCQRGGGVTPTSPAACTAHKRNTVENDRCAIRCTKRLRTSIAHCSAIPATTFVYLRIANGSSTVTLSEATNPTKAPDEDLKHGSDQSSTLTPSC